MKNSSSPQDLCSKFNECAKMIVNLNYERLMHLLEINEISYRTILVLFMLEKKVIIKNRKTYNFDSKIGLPLPVGLFVEFKEYYKKYTQEHKSKNILPKTKNETQPELSTLVKYPQNKATVNSEQKIKVLREIFQRNISDESAEIIMNSLDIKI